MELFATLAVVALAAAFLARRAWRTFLPRTGAGAPRGGGGCGCAGAKAGCPATSDAVRRMQSAVRGLNRG